MSPARTMQTMIAFKEWQVVCDALASGRQTILLRKGGIHEGRAGFSFAHESFLLFPTRFHVQPAHVREGEPVSLPEWRAGESVRITHHVILRRAVTITCRDRLAALEAHHIYTAETLLDRFDWQGKGMPGGSIHVAVAEVRELPQAWEFPYAPSYGGCRSWVEVPAPPDDRIEAARPVLGRETLDRMVSLVDGLAAESGKPGPVAAIP